MCRLFGLTAGRERVAATFWLLDDANSLVAQSEDNPDGAGLGTFDDEGAPLIEKQPLAAYDDAAFHEEAKDRRSTTFVAHVRHSTGTPDLTKNTHPFEMDGLIGAHNGAIGEVEKLERELGPAMDLVHGDTDSERILALVARNVRRGMGVADAMSAAASWLAENVPVTSVNLVVAGPHDLWAMRYPEKNELWIREQPADGSTVRHHSAAGTRVHSDDLAGTPSVVVASERLDDAPGWRLLPSGTVVHVTPELEVIERLAVTEEPARRS